LALFCSLASLAFFLSLAVSVALHQRKQAEAAFIAAKQQALVAKEQRFIAERQADIASHARMEAERATEEAEMQRARADAYLKQLTQRGENSSAVNEKAVANATRIHDLAQQVSDLQQSLAQQSQLSDQYRQQATQSQKLADYYQAQVNSRSRNIQDAESASWFIKEYRKPLVSALIGLIALALFSTRLIALVLQAEVWPIAQVATAFYLTPFGRFKLFRRYRKEVKANALKSESRYVDLPYRCRTGASDQRNLRAAAREYLQEGNVTVIAEGGRGKTMLCDCLVADALEGRVFGRKGRRIPVLLDSLSYTGNLVASLTTVLVQHHVYANDHIIESQLIAGNLLVIFDGFSEVPDVYTTTDQGSDVPSSVRRFPDTRFVFTSRIPLPPAVQVSLDSPAEIVLEDLGGEGERALLSRYLDKRGDSLDSLICQLNAIPVGIPRTPLMLRLAAELYDESGEVPSERTRLFQRYIEKLLRPEAVGGNEEDGLEYGLRHLVRNTFLLGGGDRGMTVDRAVRLLSGEKEMLEAYSITILPIKLVHLYCQTGLLRRSGQILRFFHDSFEGYFAAKALLADWQEKRFELLQGSKHNPRFSEVWDFLRNLVSTEEWLSMDQALAAERAAGPPQDQAKSA
jgi:hypothetical protein